MVVQGVRAPPRLSESPFVYCEIYEYCMTFEEPASPDKSFFFHRLSPLLLNACDIMNSCKFPI